jgi:hypothetical protein
MATPTTYATIAEAAARPGATCVVEVVVLDTDERRYLAIRCPMQMLAIACKAKYGRPDPEGLRLVREVYEVPLAPLPPPTPVQQRREALERIVALQDRIAAAAYSETACIRGDSSLRAQLDAAKADLARLDATHPEAREQMESERAAYLARLSRSID